MPAMPASKPTPSGAAQVSVTLHRDHVETLLRILADPDTNISDLERDQIVTELEAHV